MTKRPDPITSHEMVVDVFRGPHATIAHVRSYAAVGGLMGVGDSKRAPGDKSSQLVGDNLAIARALRDLADQLQESADRLGEALNPTPPPKPEPMPKVYVVNGEVFNDIFSAGGMVPKFRVPEPVNPLRSFFDFIGKHGAPAKITGV